MNQTLIKLAETLCRELNNSLKQADTKERNALVRNAAGAALYYHKPVKHFIDSECQRISQNVYKTEDSYKELPAYKKDTFVALKVNGVGTLRTSVNFRDEVDPKRAYIVIDSGALGEMEIDKDLRTSIGIIDLDAILKIAKYYKNDTLAEAAINLISAIAFMKETEVHEESAEKFFGASTQVQENKSQSNTPTQDSERRTTMIKEHKTEEVVSEFKKLGEDALKLAAGQAGLATVRAFILNAIPRKMGFLAKLTGRKAAAHKFLNSPLGGFIITASVHTFFTILMPNNKRLLSVTRVALNAAMVELTMKVPYQAMADSLAAQLVNNEKVANFLSQGCDNADKNEKQVD